MTLVALVTCCALSRYCTDDELYFFVNPRQGVSFNSVPLKPYSGVSFERGSTLATLQIKNKNVQARYLSYAGNNSPFSYLGSFALKKSVTAAIFDLFGFRFRIRSWFV